LVFFLFCISSCLVCFLVDCLLTGPTDSQLKGTTRTNCCIYTVWATNMSETCRGWL